MHYFTAQIRPPKTLRATLYRKPHRKRRKLDADEDGEQPLPQAEDGHDDDHVPPHPFPHAPAKASGQRHGAAKVQQGMASLTSPIYAANARSEKSTLGQQPETIASKKRHLSVLSTVMHRCLLEGDYERAGRAWGLILRTQVAGGQFVDPCNNDRWGIGAEILLRRKPQPLADQGKQPRRASHDSHVDTFSQEGFARAREYYERIIVQHPYKAAAPNAVDARSFYPAMFALWIFEACEESKRARRRAQEESARRSRSSSPMSVDGDTDDSQVSENAIKRKELAQAKEIAGRLDLLIDSPPFDKDPNLLLLRGNVGLWISDLVAVLSVSKVTAVRRGSEEDDDHNSNQSDENSLESGATELEGLKASRRELVQAHRLMQRAVQNGAQVNAATSSNIELKLDDVASKIQVMGESLHDYGNEFSSDASMHADDDDLTPGAS